MGTLVPPCRPPKWVGREAQGKRNLYTTAQRKIEGRRNFLGKKTVASGRVGPLNSHDTIVCISVYYSGGYIGVGVIGRCDEQMRLFPNLGFLEPVFNLHAGLSTVNQARPNSYLFLVGGFKMFLIFTPNFGEDVQFDEHIFSNGLVQQPTRFSCL